MVKPAFLRSFQKLGYDFATTLGLSIIIDPNGMHAGVKDIAIR